MKDDIYEKLARHLDNLPGGFPATESGVEMRILRRLFAPEEAELAVHLSLMPKKAQAIARRTGLSLEEVSARLEEMAQKGLIFTMEKEGKAALYGASQYVIGIWEYQVDKLNPELIEEMNQYIPTLMNLETWKKAPQLRTIPVGRSLTVQRDVLPHEKAEALVRAQKKFLVAPCICRREHTMVGKGCTKPEETCLVFGIGADYYERNNMGRLIDLEEALEILRKADEAGLVLQPSNAKDVVNICCCCGCCCQVLKTIKRHPHPASVVSTPYVVAADPDSCEGCGTCVDRCQMEALTLEEDKVSLQADRCIGCGLCVTTCPSGSLSLVRKPKQEQQAVPKNMIMTLLHLKRVRHKLGAKRP
ncbi:MAG: 4Fe-4S binding protein [Thermodesulfobacteriota bacterium]|nr:4Fe-4S binding protein [Thermodesulfobacteriota bacterium]